jgi:hypothetical protein
MMLLVISVGLVRTVYTRRIYILQHRDDPQYTACIYGSGQPSISESTLLLLSVWRVLLVAPSRTCLFNLLIV